MAIPFKADQINGITDAKNFLRYLYSNGLSYHPEDDAADIINGTTGEPLFSRNDAQTVNNIMAKIYTIPNFDPCEYLLLLEK